MIMIPQRIASMNRLPGGLASMSWVGGVGGKDGLNEHISPHNKRP